MGSGKESGGNGRAPVIVGVADIPLHEGRVTGGLNVLAIQALTAKEALESAGLTFGDVDGLLTAGSWGIPGPGNMMSLTVAEYLGIQPRYMDGTQIGGSSFVAHVAHAALALQAGYCNVALITYGSTQRSLRERSMAGRSPGLTLQFETPYGLPSPVGAYAMAAHRHMYEYGTTSEQLADIAVATRGWAALNPEATMRGTLTREDVLGSTMIAEPLHLLDCCLVTDGGGAIVMTTAERARDLKKPPLHVRGYGETLTHATIGSMPDLTLTGAAESGRQAMDMAGVSPGDFDVVEIYDSFTITVLLTLEALGFCGRGEGGAFVEGGRTGPGGDFPLNTNGGGLSCAHPGMYGLYVLIEAARQLWNECTHRGDNGEGQVPDARLALAHGTGGVLSSTVTCVLSRE